MVRPPLLVLVRARTGSVGGRQILRPMYILYFFFDSLHIFMLFLV